MEIILDYFDRICIEGGTNQSVHIQEAIRILGY